MTFLHWWHSETEKVWKNLIKYVNNTYRSYIEADKQRIDRAVDHVSRVEI